MPNREAYQVAIYTKDTDNIGKYVLEEGHFILQAYTSLTDLIAKVTAEIDVLVLMADDCEDAIVESLKKLRETTKFKVTPIVVAELEGRTLDPIQVFDAGCSDIVDRNMPFNELLGRVDKLVFHARAEQVLRKTADDARKVTMSVMTESSNLGLTVQYLIDSNFCDNVDELGMQLFQSLKHYNLRCSLQLRSHFKVKNMEETGMEKELEARLLTELQHKGRYVDFGKRCVVNYGQVSLLIKNMPVDDPEECTKIKDSILPFIQGTDSRLKAIDAQKTLEVERNFMGKVVGRLRESMTEFDDGYQQLMRGSADIVEDMAAKMEDSILFLDLTQEQEQTIETIMSSGVAGINAQFSQGVQMNEGFGSLVKQMSAVFGEGDSVPNVDKLLELSSKL